MKFKIILLFAGMLTACQVADAQRGLFNFERVVLDDRLDGGYGVELADIDGDGLTDIVAVAINPGQLAWFRNPDWQKFPIATGTEGNVDTAPHDIDGDGDIDIAMISDFSLQDSNAGGVIDWFENPGSPAQDQVWTRHPIDQVPTSHRIRWGDINGDGAKELVNVPIIGIGATAPDYEVPLQLKAYSIPADLSAARWTGVVLDESLELAHSFTLQDWDADGREDILTASFGGVHVFQLASRGVTVAKTQVGAGRQGAERPAIGASEVDVGSLADGQRFLATIEPWHGNEVVVYTQGMGQLWERRVIDSDIANGHGLATVDLNNDGVHEIVAGGRSEPYQLAVFTLTENGWRRMDLDTGVALSGIAVDDLNGDGLNDIVGIGAATRNLVYYRNTGP